MIDNTITFVEVTKDSYASIDGKQAEPRKKGQKYRGKAEFLNVWIASKFAKPITEEEYLKKETKKKDEEEE